MARARSLTSPLKRLVPAIAASLTGGPLSAEVRRFLENVAYLVGADMLATVLTFALSAWVVRVMGPAEFGLANLAMSNAQLVLIPMLLGLHAAVARAIAANSTPGPVMGSALLLIAVLILVFSGVASIVAVPVTTVTGLSLAVYLVSLPLAAALALQYALQGMLNGLRRFRSVAFNNIWSAAFYAVLIIAVLISGAPMTFWIFVAITAGRSLVMAVLSLANIWRLVSPPTRHDVVMLAQFGATYSLGSVASLFALAAIDSLMLNAYHGAAAVGLYGAYYVTFNVVASRVTRFVSDVLLPTAAAHEQPFGLVFRILRVMLGPGCLVIPAAMVLARGLFAVYGEAYSFSWVAALLLGLCIYLHVGVSMTGDLMVAGGVRDVLASTAIMAVTAIANVAGNVLLIPSYEVAGSLMATVMSSLIGFGLRVVYLINRSHQRLGR